MMTIEIIMAYTNINFTDKQKEDVSKLYDLFVSNDIVTQIFDIIPDTELEFIIDTTWDTIEHIYSYRNSIMGLLENINRNYEQLNFDATNIQNAIKDPENLSLLKDILTKLG